MFTLDQLTSNVDDLKQVAVALSEATAQLDEKFDALKASIQGQLSTEQQAKLDAVGVGLEEIKTALASARTDTQEVLDEPIEPPAELP